MAKKQCDTRQLFDGYKSLGTEGAELSELLWSNGHCWPGFESLQHPVKKCWNKETKQELMTRSNEKDFSVVTLRSKSTNQGILIGHVTYLDLLYYLNFSISLASLHL